MIVFYNPHICDAFSMPPHFILLKRKALKKYGYIFDGIIQDGKKINVFVDHTLSAYIPDKYFNKLPKWLKSLIVCYEIRKWVGINGLKGKVIFFDIKNADKAVLFGMSSRVVQGNFDARLGGISQFKKVFFHLSHYFVSTDQKSINLEKIANLYLCGDSDITNNAYFIKYFSWYKKEFMIVPFSVQERFIKKNEIINRSSKLVATGTFHDLYSEEPKFMYSAYINFFNCSAYHPIRKELFDRKSELLDSVDVYTSQYRENLKKNRLMKIFSRFYVRQKQYFSIDLVTLYNNYRFAVVGEENVGFPAIGAFEAMACGCILIAQPAYYQGLEMKAGIEYISYDGTLKHLLQVLGELRQKEITELKMFSDAAIKYVSANMRSDALYRRFFKLLADHSE